jgi:DNA-binding PadR family transcriptional regulator
MNEWWIDRVEEAPSGRPKGTFELGPVGEEEFAGWRRIVQE